MHNKKNIELNELEGVFSFSFIQKLTKLNLYKRQTKNEIDEGY